MLLKGGLGCVKGVTKSIVSATVSVENSRGRVIVITGPTAVGKSAAAISLAQRVNGEIISADSIQIYRGLDVGSAKVTWAERQNVPHHLLDIVNPTEEYTAENFFHDAKMAADTILARGRVPIVVGGSGIFLRWFLNGKLGSPKPTKEQAATVSAFLSRLQRKGESGWDEAIRYLAEADDIHTARRLKRGDWRGLRRALEIIEITYRPQTSLPSPLFPQVDYDLQCYFMYMDRKELHRRIDQRCEEMLIGCSGRGLIEEARWLLDLGIMPNTSPSSRAIGYRQAMDYLLACKKSMDAASVPEFFSFLQQFQGATRNYADRQLTWFLGEDIFRWVDGSYPENVVNLMEQEYWKKSKEPLSFSPSSFLESRRRMTSNLRARFGPQSYVELM
ncbi:hypothetical protein R1sor_025570 [Riccia sorocarpa]|uniref:tRNA dimethylallyltransferase n=1 Tax=Riccia sorocarpa TaxID=122646 RepID=A0ABD3GBR4_9MARC